MCVLVKETEESVHMLEAKTNEKTANNLTCNYLWSTAIF